MGSIRRCALSRRFIWPNWRSHLRTHLKRCEDCILKKDDKEQNKEKLLPLESKTILERVHLNVAGPLSEPAGYRYLLVAQDSFSKWLAATPLKKIASRLVQTVGEWWIQFCFYSS